MAGTIITGTVLNGVTLGSFAAQNPVTVTGSIDIGTSVNPGALYGPSPSAWTVTNQGSITGGAVDGIALGASGVVTNSGTGFIGGHVGVLIRGAAGIVTNSAVITAVNAGAAESANRAAGILLPVGGSVTNAATGHITGQGTGIQMPTGLGTVVNNGFIAGNYYAGVYTNSGIVTNNANAVITGGTHGGGGAIGAAGWGVAILNNGTLNNSGIISGTGQGGAYLGSGTVTNSQTGTISGVWGIAMAAAAGTVANAGLLKGTVQSGVFLKGGSVANAATGTITGPSGVTVRYAAGTWR